MTIWELGVSTNREYVRFDLVIPNSTNKTNMTNAYILEVLLEYVVIGQELYDYSEEALSIIDMLGVGKGDSTSTIMDLINQVESQTPI